MGLMDFIKSVKTISADEVRNMIRGKNIDDYQLIDVRQPKEYEQGHIPGAVLLPLGDIEKFMNEYDPDKPIVVYCAIGGRSRAAASFLYGAGIKEVYSLAGGIKAWNSAVVSGPPDAGMVHFRDLSRLDEVIAVAWAFEEGSMRFYRHIEEQHSKNRAAKIFAKLSKAEEKHKAVLTDLYYKAKGDIRTADYPDYYTSLSNADLMIEGGLKFKEAMDWAKNKTVVDIVDFSMSIESRQYDLYMRMMRMMTDGKAEKSLRLIAQEEKNHLERLTEFFEDAI